MNKCEYVKIRHEETVDEKTLEDAPWSQNVTCRNKRALFSWTTLMSIIPGVLMVAVVVWMIFLQKEIKRLGHMNAVNRDHIQQLQFELSKGRGLNTNQETKKVKTAIRCKGQCFQILLEIGVSPSSATKVDERETKA